MCCASSARWSRRRDSGCSRAGATSRGAHTTRWAPLASLSLPAHETACSHVSTACSQGYFTQPVYACRTCAKQSGNMVGVCFACYLRCHLEHDTVELYHKHGFRCDCGTAAACCACEFDTDDTPRCPCNSGNHYNHNFAGRFCWCDRPYDPVHNAKMVQCAACEDWFHDTCIKQRFSVCVSFPTHPNPSSLLHERTPFFFVGTGCGACRQRVFQLLLRPVHVPSGQHPVLLPAGVHPPRPGAALIFVVLHSCRSTAGGADDVSAAAARGRRRERRPLRARQRRAEPRRVAGVSVPVRRVPGAVPHGVLPVGVRRGRRHRRRQRPRRAPARGGGR